MLTTHTTGNARRTSSHHDRLAMNSCDSESLLEEKYYKAAKRETPTIEYYKATETEKHLDHNPSQAKYDSCRTSGTKKLTEHWSNHVRPESHDTSTNIPNLHVVREGQLGGTMRDTKQPCEKQCLTTGTATSDLHKVEGPQVEPTYTSNTPRGQETTPYSATTDGTKERVIETEVEYQHSTPRENPQNRNH
ncbi:hypothetical protein Taro_013261 [Colocasia esculenta]|uniref:Uncharacterized protein n=1 Tax=Colocasia esculenta TaxID=4460 RepID=A0A843UB35_COLES|nr:hypothetical protein [Colocasia esculenta]